jgi:glycosyltransferase involved in cell wall biosynthesis
LFVAGADFFSGAERALFVTARAMVEAGHSVVVACGTDGELLAQFRTHNIPAECVPVERTSWTRPWAVARSIASLSRLARRHRVTVVHANEAPSFQAAGYAARLLGIPAVTHVRFPEGTDGYRWYLKPGFGRAIFVSEYLRRDVVERAPKLFGDRTDVLYDGVEVPDMPNERDRAAGRAALSLADDRPVVALTGQVVEIKGIWDYIEAARLLASRGCRATFVVLGDDLKNDGRTRLEAEQRVRTLGLAASFRFLGFRSDAPALIPLFDVVTVPSHVEPLGNATLEAMASGLPVIGSRVGGIPEMIVPGETGLLVPPKAPPALADAVATLVADAALRARLGAAGRARVQEVFSPAAHARNLTRIYERVFSR